jgi:hypothetical protein
VVARPQRSPAVLLVTVAALLAIVLAVTVLRGSGTGSPPAARITPGNAGAATHGEARISGAGRGGTYLQLVLHDIPPPAAGKHYEVWVLPRGAVTMRPIGAFRPSGRDVSLRLPLPGGGPYRAVDVSVQDDGGPDVNSGVHLAGGSFEP